MTLVCIQCGNPRTYGSARRCRACYCANARVRCNGTPFGQVLNELLEGERLGMYKALPGGRWGLSEHYGPPAVFEPIGDGWEMRA